MWIPSLAGAGAGAGAAASTSGERMKKMRAKKVKRPEKTLEVELEDAIDGGLPLQRNKLCGSSDQNQRLKKEREGERRRVVGRRIMW